MYEQGSKPRVVMIAAFEGWNDACQCATDMIRYLVSRFKAQEVGHINRDGYYDLQAARPMQFTIQGRRRVLWPQTTFYDITISEDLHILAQLGPEPNYQWVDYCDESLHMAKRFDVKQIFTFGAMFADVPHSRTLPLDITHNGQPVDDDRAYSGPIGITHVLDTIAFEQGYETTMTWVSIPQYLGNDSCPQGSLQLFNELVTLLGIKFDAQELETKAKQWLSRANSMVNNNADLNQFVDKLEREYDMEEQARILAAANTPEVEQLVQEAEKYLRDMPQE